MAAGNAIACSCLTDITGDVTISSMDIVQDTNVFVAALRSLSGASAEVLDRCLALDDLAIMGTALFAEYEDLKIAAGRVPVTIQVLAPNHRPVQITKSLKNFWVESYPKLKLELQRKYPKHEWR